MSENNNLDVEPPSALNELKSTSHRCNWVCGCPGVTEEPEQYPHTSWKFGVRVQGRREEPDIGKLCPWKQTSGNSWNWEGWRHGNKRLLDLLWQTSPRTWSETRPVWPWAFWTPDAWLRGSIAADLKLDATPILLWNNEVPAVEPGLPVKRRDHLDGLLPQESDNFLF